MVGNMDMSNGKKGVYDYFIRDYQENIGMILSEESHYSLGQCTMETSRAANEEPVSGQTGGGNEVATTRFTKPTGWTSNTSNSVSKVSKAIGKPIGPNSLLKVMAGDVVNASTQYYYGGAVTNNNNSFVGDVVNNLLLAITGSNVTSATTKAGTTGIGSNLNGSTPFANITDPHKNTTDNYPRAYLSVLFFDERFNFVEEGSSYIRTTQSGDGASPLVLANIKAPKNGYAYIYVSNENDEPVYFDNLQVAHDRGRIIEENHYYAFGLKIAGISSKKLGDFNEGMLDNKNLYNDKELIDEADLNWHDYGFRNYDAQIGRFPQLDPLTDSYPELTNYQYASNDPIANIDLDGLEGVYYVTVKTVVKNTAQVANAGGIFTKGFSIASIGITATKIASNAVNDKLRQSGIATQCVKCHPDNSYIAADQQRIATEYAMLDRDNGQVDFPRNKISDIINGERDYNGWVVNADGYVTKNRTPYTGTPPAGITGISSLKGGFDAVRAFRNAISILKGGKLTNAGRAVTKHPKYFGFEALEELQQVYRTPEAINQLGSHALKDILRNGVKTTGAGGRYPNGWVTHTLQNGNAASWGADGTFIGFRGVR